MKRLFLMFLVSGIGIQLKAQSADEIVAKHVEALGGKDVVAKVATVVREGAISMQGMEIPITLSQKQNTGFRLDLSVMGTTGYQIYTQKEGWSYMPFGGKSEVEVIDAAKVKDGQDDLDPQGLLFNYKEKGHTVTLLGSEKANGADCFKLKVVMGNGTDFTYLINKETGLLVQVNTSRETPEGTKNGEVVYSDYKKVDGFMVAHKITREEGEVVISKVTVNGKLEDSIFKPSN